MAFDPGIAQRLREYFAGFPEVVERKMFGGLVFMVYGHMSCGVVEEVLMVRVGPEQHRQAMSKPHTREMDFTGKPLRGFIFVDPEGFEADEDLAGWLEMSLDFVTALPPK